MALHVPKAPGFQSMMKEGARVSHLNDLFSSKTVQHRTNTKPLEHVVNDFSLVQFYSGLDEVTFRNIDACKELAETTKSAYGPNGMNKMVINHLEKLFVTNDAATIMREIEVCFLFCIIKVAYSTTTRHLK